MVLCPASVQSSAAIAWQQCREKSLLAQQVSMIVQNDGVSADGYHRYAQRCPELMNDPDQTVGQCRVSNHPSASDRSHINAFCSSV
jgi:hypothetical protein